MNHADLDGSLPSWEEIKYRHTWRAILIGNGASCAIWQKFGYPSIYAYAKSNGRLSTSAIALFERSHTENFEYVMHDLIVASRVQEALGSDHSQVDSLYSSIKEALVASIKEVHIPWEMAREKLRDIYDSLTQHEEIFSTNYDLLVYWAINECGPGPFKDYYWSDGNTFDLRDLRKGEGSKWVYYVHGGLHLEELPSGTARKLTNDRSTLLSQFGTSRESGVIPLIVTEGSAENKMRAIQYSAYLSFVLAQFSANRGPLVIFGHSLGDSDDHILAAIRRWPNPLLAISILPGTNEQIISTKARFVEKLPSAGFTFFDATTHPLGSPALLVTA